MRTIQLGDGRTTISSPYMNLYEAAIYCHCEEATLTKALTERTVTYHQFDFDLDQVLFCVDDLDGFVKNHEVLSKYNYQDDPDDDAIPK